LNMKIGFARFMKVQQSLDKVNSAVREYLSGVRVVKAFNRFDFEVDKFQMTNEEQRFRSVHAMRAMAIFNPAIMLTVNLAVVAILWIGGIWINTGVMASNQVGEIVAFTNYMMQILFALMMISMVFNMFVRARASTLRINEVFKQVNEMNWKEGVFDAGKAQGRVDFANVNFAFAGTEGSPVLKNVSFTIE